ncbi:hypothetical protein D3C84_1028940 [compost metagenome]
MSSPGLARNAVSSVVNPKIPTSSPSTSLIMAGKISPCSFVPPIELLNSGPSSESFVMFTLEDTIGNSACLMKFARVAESLSNSWFPSVMASKSN